MDLTEQDRDLLATYHTMSDLIRHRTRTVALRHQTGAYLVGRPGSGKSHTVMETLADMGVDCHLEKSKLTAAALFDLIEAKPDHILVLDDLPTLFKDKAAQQILLAALGGHPSQPRVVTYTTKRDRRPAYFTGGIIGISNLPLGRDPVASAVASRVQMLEFEPTDAMLVSFIRRQSMAGYGPLTPEECGELAEFVASECRDMDYRMDLRFYFKGLGDYLYVKEQGERPDLWRDLVRSSMRRIVYDVTQPTEGREARKDWEARIARELAGSDLDRAERDAEWVRITGKSVDTYYRRIRELQAAAPRWSSADLRRATVESAN